MHYLKISLGGLGLLFLGMTPFYNVAAIGFALVFATLTAIALIEKRRRERG
ncbi:MAG: hypothetical protein RIG84_18770 [Roseovarius sp.]